ncbi:DUF6292 family protein [Kitasatospora sp. NPDC057542]|uniref:DUF6292 family protein n=1 Tax=Kitasatospora sp. NPDC057542 TaxID=3346162 RepID=UPI003695C01E
MTSIEKLTRSAWAYTAAVAAELLTQDYPVTKVNALDLSDEEPGQAEVEAYISLPIPWWPRTFPTITEGALDWDSTSGWVVRAEVRQNDSTKTVTTDYWMGDGLTPDPAKVALFLTAARVNGLAATGSTDRPYYRRPGQDDPAPLIARLLPYEDTLRKIDPHRDFPGPRSARNSFRALLHEQHERILHGNLTALPEVRMVPLRAGEAAALTFLLEASDTADGEALAADLRTRYQAAPKETAERSIPAEHSTALARADRHKAG